MYDKIPIKQIEKDIIEYLQVNYSNKKYFTAKKLSGFIMCQLKGRPYTSAELTPGLHQAELHGYISKRSNRTWEVLK